jgi:hypothetical protein
MRRNSKHSSAEHALFGDEEAAAMRSELTELRSLVEEVGNQVQSQFTTIAAHAEIARQQAEFFREEAHANLERTRDMLIGLLEQVRRDMGDLAYGPLQGGTRAPWSPPGPSALATSERLAALEAKVAVAVDSAAYCFDRQQELADTMSAFLDTMIFEARNEPVAALRLA